MTTPASGQSGNQSEIKPQSFTDANNDVWPIKANLSMIRQVVGMQETEKPSNPLDGGEGFVRLFDDALFLVDCLAVFCGDQIKAKKLTNDQFANLVLGETLGDARKACMLAIARCMPRKCRRNAAAELIDLLEESEERAVDLALAKTRKSVADMAGGDDDSDDDEETIEQEAA